MSDDSAGEGWTVGALQRWTTRYFTDKGIPNARLDADLILAHALGMERIQVYTRFDQPVNPRERDALRPLVRRRASREPLAYILGHKEFYGLRFEVGPATLIPRPESEHLVEEAIAALAAHEAPTVLDLGVGSGCLILSILANLPTARGVGVDQSEAALAQAAANALRLEVYDRVEFRRGSWFEPAQGAAFDLVVSNPPYIATQDIDSLQPEITQHEPRAALDGGPDGLDCVRVILEKAGGHVRPGGALLMEIGDGQAQRVAEMLPSLPGWEAPVFKRDYGGVLRLLKLTRVANG